MFDQKPEGGSSIYSFSLLRSNISKFLFSRDHPSPPLFFYFTLIVSKDLNVNKTNLTSLHKIDKSKGSKNVYNVIWNDYNIFCHLVFLTLLYNLEMVALTKTGDGAGGGRVRAVGSDGED